MLNVVRNQKYVTFEQTTIAAEHSRKAAIHCSALHWKQLATAPLSDLINKTPGFSIGECALCGKFNQYDCSNCPLFVALGGVKCHTPEQLYDQASNIIEALRCNEYFTKTSRDIVVKRFRRTAEKLMKIIEGLK